ncbi:F-box/kelch-repeat protein At3g23880-like [Vicia villosa]|uniref:F-box/kelch-repeat protein At3g23880-like n=1 Tax=Vicia villosa TaxID=3911 RepID=UPI00273C5F2B|nr:F-box/kelch-repeat protein At3g23880-like [Vicia villosa]
MNLLPPNVSPSPVFLPEELVAEVLSFLPVKTLLRLRCVSKLWKSLISHPTFVRQHLNRSAGNADLTLVSSFLGLIYFKTFPLLDPITMTLPNDPYHQSNDIDGFNIVGSCNGLLCLLSFSYIGHKDMYLRFWNPATRIISEKLGYFSDHTDPYHPRNLTFGYDHSTDTYKVVCFIPNTREVRVFSLGHNAWRNIQNSPLDHYYRMNIVNLNGRVIWLEIHNDTGLGPIISLDLSTETHTRFLPPDGFDEGLLIESKLSVLNDCLCFSHDLKLTELVIWQMKEFGVEDSWTQIFKISYDILDINEIFLLLPLCLLKKNDTLILTDKFLSQFVLYNWRDDRAKSIPKSWPLNSKIYVESLVWYG